MIDIFNMVMFLSGAFLWIFLSLIASATAITAVVDSIRNRKIELLDSRIKIAIDNIECKRTAVDWDSGGMSVRLL